MSKKLIHIPIFFLFLTALTGVWMRSISLMPNIPSLPYDHILHGHSHIAILGWMFFAVLIIYMAIIWRYLPSKKQAKSLLTLSTIVTLFMLLAFLYEGYALYSIILSTLHIVTEYWAILFIFTTIKLHPAFSEVSRLFIKTGAIMLFISSFGPFGLGAIASTGLKDSPLFEMAIYFYLHFQYNGWLYYLLVGFFIYFFEAASIRLNKSLLKGSFLIYTVALFPGFLLSILWYELGQIGYLFAVLGAGGQFIGVSLFIYVLWQIRKETLHAFESSFLYVTLFSVSILLVKAMMELGLIIPQLADLVYDTRHVVVAYLHLTLLGFISFALFACFIQLKLVPVHKQLFQFGLYTFMIGFCLNELILFSSTLFEWFNLGHFPLHNSLLFIASILMLMSIIFIWYTIFYSKEVKLAQIYYKKRKA